jgi:hypothetical protein
MATGAARFLILFGASIFGVLGGLHLAYTLFSDKFLPRDRALVDAMKATSPVLTRDMTMWDAWIGFNASHSLGALLLAAFYLVLAGLHMDVLVRSQSLLAVGVVAGLAYLWVGYVYWFRTPFIGVAVATACFIAALVVLAS